MNETPLGKALAEFMEEDEDTARTALEKLWEYSSPSLLRYMQSRYPSQRVMDCEDIVQEAFIKVWRARSRFKDQGPAAWHKYLRIVAARCYLDRCTGYAPVVNPENIDQIPDSEIPLVADLFDAVQQTETISQIYHAADVLWLGVQPQLTAEQLTRRVLAAKWFYLEGVAWQEIIALVGPGAFDEPPLTQRILDDWLADKGVLSALCFEELYCSNDSLAWQMLGFAEPVQLDTLNALSKEVSSDTLTDETAAILWRYRHGLRPDDIAGRGLKSLNNIQLLALFDSLEPRLPFKHKMQHLLDSLEPTMGVGARDILCQVGLWQRLAFQYSYADDLTQPDIYERLHPAAEVVGYHLTPGMLNVWLSNRRLVIRLAQHYFQHREAQHDG